ncbi:M23 family metallopeptidase [Oculatella sp. LEGE 06141]|nr:M23 family metallopeptidase [Oculatella sp. LEGE 06141]
MLVGSTAPGEPDTLAQTVSLTQAAGENESALVAAVEATDRRDLKSDASQSDASNIEKTASAPSVDFKLDRAVGSALSKSLNKVGVASSVGVPIAVQSAFDWWTYLAKGEEVSQQLYAIAKETSAESEAIALDDTVLGDRSLVSALEQHLPKAANKAGVAKAQTVALAQSATPDKAAPEGCAGVQPIYYNPAFSVDTAALQHSRWGRISFPLAIPAAITSAFGWRIHPISGDRRFHAGIDIGAPTGTPVLAALPGRVVAADYMGGYGLAVIVENSETAQRNVYAHLSGIAVQPGMVLQQGTVLGFVGSTGNSTGPHLHFETQVLTSNGWVAIDPLAVAAGVTVSQGN